ncbi:MAG: hypothetical protein WAW80_02955 [Candidatus Saccharimonadales bacterium]
MNRKVLLLMATVGGIVGGYVPVLFGDNELLDGWSILFGTIGGIVGIWLGVVLSRRFG